MDIRINSNWFNDEEIINKEIKNDTVKKDIIMQEDFNKYMPKYKTNDLPIVPQSYENNYNITKPKKKFNFQKNENKFNVGYLIPIIGLSLLFFS
jgi:hypothetical protein